MNSLNLEPATRLLALLSVIAGILAVTLFPAHVFFFPAGHHPAHFSLAVFLGNLRLIDGVDVVQNILLFLPFGFLVAAFFPAGSYGPRAAAMAAAAGLGLSFTIEFLQAWVPGRFSSHYHVLLNGLGAWCGAIAAARLARIRI